MNIVRRVGFNLALLFAASLLSVEAIQAQDRPLNRADRPENLRVTKDNGVTTAQWDPVAEATRYVLKLEAAVGCNGRRHSSELWTFDRRGAPTSLPFPDEFVRSGTPVQMTLTAYKSPIGSSPSLSNRIEYTPPGDPASARSCRSGSNNDDRGWDGIPIGAMGQIFREEGDRLKVYEAVSATQGVLALDVSQTEVDEVLAATNNGICVKTSANRRVVLYVLPNMDVLISMGPNPQGKILHTELEGGLQGAVTSTVTTFSGDPVAEATRYVLKLEADVGCNGRRHSSELWTFDRRGAPTSLPFPDEFVQSGTPVRMTLTAYKSPIGSSPSLSNRIEYTPPGDPASTRSCRSGSNSDDRGWDGIPIGAMGQIFREEGDRLKVYEAVSATQGVLALDVSQTEVDEVLAATNNGICVKTSANRRVVLYVLPNMDVLISMGPNPQGKIVHTELEGGLQGAVTSTVTTFDEMPPGVGCMTVMTVW